jgi:hypothetical protein
MKNIRVDRALLFVYLALTSIGCVHNKAQSSFKPNSLTLETASHFHQRLDAFCWMNGIQVHYAGPLAKSGHSSLVTNNRRIFHWSLCTSPDESGSEIQICTVSIASGPVSESSLAEIELDGVKLHVLYAPEWSAVYTSPDQVLPVLNGRSVRTFFKEFGGVPDRQATTQF